MQQVHVIEQNDMSIHDYYSIFDRLVGSLTSMVAECIAADCPAHKFLHRFLRYRFVMGAREEFDSLRRQLFHGDSDLTMAQALSALLAEETRLQSMSSSVSLSHSVLTASQRYNMPKATSFEPCKHYSKKNHASENCFSHYPEKLAEYRAARGRGTSRATRGRGSTSTTRGSVSVAAASPIGAAQSSWVLDSGASFHVTSGRSQLVACKPVNDDASIQTADGSLKRGCDWDWPLP
ncbi:uncharacterized protein C2845_PM05G13050 [Panicum miliaceum]|uniref:Retrotransposon gag domain-containing protein n=1 Tax=Panicum miliaceum TaxID=4540 RepID=A0A3L6T2C9_PANMI|nr:uncharacterized protein C2845_PM05G13050 [Panicum miliaceum]